MAITAGEVVLERERGGGSAMEGPDLASLEWRKSSASGNGGGDCVEVAATDSGVLVRNSRFPSGPVVEFTWAEWRAFLEGVARGEFPAPAPEG